VISGERVSHNRALEKLGEGGIGFSIDDRIS
jgi:hypothetical protein